jgi:hypothetical protein
MTTINTADKPEERNVQNYSKFEGRNGAGKMAQSDDRRPKARVRKTRSRTRSSFCSRRCKLLRIKELSQVASSSSTISVGGFSFYFLIQFSAYINMSQATGHTVFYHSCGFYSATWSRFMHMELIKVKLSLCLTN